jgi:hypothetical protein
LIKTLVDFFEQFLKTPAQQPFACVHGQFAAWEKEEVGERGGHNELVDGAGHVEQLRKPAAALDSKVLVQLAFAHVGIDQDASFGEGSRLGQVGRYRRVAFLGDGNSHLWSA